MDTEKKVGGVLSLLKKTMSKMEAVIVLATILLFAFATTMDPSFMNVINIISMLNYLSYIGIIAVPLIFLLVARMLDMSIGSATGMFAVILALAVKSGVPLALAMLMVIACALLLGLLNGGLITKFNFSAWVVTLATLYICRGIQQGLAGGGSIGGLPLIVSAIGEATLLGIPINVIVFLVTAVVGGVILQCTSFGRAVYTIGNNEEIAKTSGINSKRIKFILYIATALACAVSAFFMMCNMRAALPTTGVGWEFEVVAGCMLGGCSMYGGKGSMLGGLFGMLFMVILRYAQQVFMLSSGYQIFLTGFVLIIAVLIDTLRDRKIGG